MKEKVVRGRETQRSLRFCVRLSRRHQGSVPSRAKGITSDAFCNDFRFQKRINHSRKEAAPPPAPRICAYLRLRGKREGGDAILLLFIAAERKHIVRRLRRAMGCLSKSRLFSASVRGKKCEPNHAASRVSLRSGTRFANSLA